MYDVANLTIYPHDAIFINEIKRTNRKCPVCVNCSMFVVDLKLCMNGCLLFSNNQCVRQKKREEIRFFLLSLLYKSLKLKLNAVQCAITKFHVKISASQSTIHIVRVSPSHADYVYGTHWIVCYMLQNILYKML